MSNQHTNKYSVRDALEAKQFRRVDGLTAIYEELRVEPGFNLREEGPELDAHRQAMLAHLRRGGSFPPIEVRLDATTQTPTIVDGHNRHWVYGAGLAEGLPLRDEKTGEFRVPIVIFTGNDLDRTARIIDSQEGKKLTPLELANGYKRLTGFRMTPEAIADRFSKTRQHVEQLLTLANANADVHALVQDGYVSAALAIETIRKHGEGAGDFLSEQLEKAKAGGKSKVTPSTVAGKNLPKKIVTGLVDEVDAFVELVPKDTRKKLAEFAAAQARGESLKGAQVTIDVGPLLALLETHGQVEEARAKADEKARAKAAKASQGDLAAESEAAAE